MGKFAADLAIHDQAPDFTATTAQGDVFQLSCQLERPLVLFAYPAALTPGCALEMRDFVAAATTFAQGGYRLVGISPDLPATNASFACAEQVPFTLLSDPDREMLQAWNIWGSKSVFGKQVVGVRRSTFVIDTKQRITHAWYDVKATGHVARVVRNLGLKVG